MLAESHELSDHRIQNAQTIFRVCRIVYRNVELVFSMLDRSKTNRRPTLYIRKNVEHIVEHIVGRSRLRVPIDSILSALDYS